MIKGNYCKKCGHRIFPSDQYCKQCGCKTGYYNRDAHIFTVPLYDIGFFNLDIDFSPYIESKREDFQYEICSCGYLNHVENEYCYMCGAKRSPSKLDKIFKHESKPTFSIDNMLCECGAINSNENTYCEMCGKLLRGEKEPVNTNYSNFNLEFDLY